MPGKCRPSLLTKTLDNVMCSNLSLTNKDCIKAVFEKYAERPKGEWIDHCVRDWRCSVCGKKVRFDGYCYDDKWDFCPNCGADMREK